MPKSCPSASKAGGPVFVGTLYALDAKTGAALWSSKRDGTVARGVITYGYHGAQLIAAAIGMTSSVWPTEQTTGKVIIVCLQLSLRSVYSDSWKRSASGCAVAPGV